jgi:hypothetical protein
MTSIVLTSCRVMFSQVNGVKVDGHEHGTALVKQSYGALSLRLAEEPLAA